MHILFLRNSCKSCQELFCRMLLIIFKLTHRLRSRSWLYYSVAGNSKRYYIRTLEVIRDKGCYISAVSNNFRLIQYLKRSYKGRIHIIVLYKNILGSSLLLAYLLNEYIRYLVNLYQNLFSTLPLRIVWVRLLGSNIILISHHAKLFPSKRQH